MAELQKTFDAQVSDQTRTADRADRLADKALKERQQAVFADVVSRLNDDDPSNDLTQAQLDQLLVRRDLDHALHSKLSKALNVTEPRKDDPQAVVQLYQDLEGQSDPDAFKSKALQMYADGLITKPTLDKFRSQADGSESEGQDVKHYRKFVADAIATAGAAVLDQDVIPQGNGHSRIQRARGRRGTPEGRGRRRGGPLSPVGPWSHWIAKPDPEWGSVRLGIPGKCPSSHSSGLSGRTDHQGASRRGSQSIKQLMDMAQAQAKQRQASRERK